MGLLDSALAIAEEIAPAWGVRRAAARARRRLLNSGYSQHGASTSKKSTGGWVSSSGGPDADITDNVEKLRERSRDLCMGEGLAIGALKTIRTNEIGAGLRLNAQIDAGYLGLSDDEALAWEDRVEREFSLWADTRACDAARRATFGELQALARLSQLMSGDVFALLPSVERKGDRYDLRVQLLEADRVVDPAFKDPGKDILAGVEIGDHGEPVAYYIAQRHPGDALINLRNVGINATTRVPAFGPETGRPLVLHLMESERPGQRRGVPVLAPVIEKLKQLSRYSEAELMAAVVSGMFTAAITSELPQTPLGQVLTDDQEDSASTDAVDDSTYQLGNGAIVGLAPGESITAINPARPNAGFDPFVKSILLQIGVGIGVPYHVLVMQFDGSYNTSRAALLEFWKRVNCGRAWLAANFCQPIYESWLEEAIARGYIDAPGFFDDPLARAAWCGAEWIGPTQGQLDPTKEVAAAAARVENGFSTRARETRELTGGDWWAFHGQRVREEQARRDGELVAPASSGAEVQPAAALALTSTDQATIATVDEGRAAVGLPPVGGDIGDRWIVEHAATVKADAAPVIAEAAQAEQGQNPSKPAKAAPAEPTAPDPAPNPDEGDEPVTTEDA